MGNLNEVGIIREDFRDLLSSKPGSGGLTLDEERIFRAKERFGENVVVNMGISLRGIVGDTEQITNKQLLRDAVELLDHLDTLGMEVRHKQ